MKKITIDGEGGAGCSAHFDHSSSGYSHTIEEAIGKLVRQKMANEFLDLLTLEDENLGDFCFKNQKQFGLEIEILPCYTSAYQNNEEGFKILISTIVKMGAVPVIKCNDCERSTYFFEGDTMYLRKIFSRPCEKCGVKNYDVNYSFTAEL